MATFLRPSADTNNPGSYENQLGLSTDLYQSIDEAVPDDSDYVVSPAAPSSAVYVTKLASGTDPGTDDGMILYARMRKSPSGAAQINMTAELRQGYVSEGSQGTLICTISVSDINATATTYSHALSTAEGASITDFTDLYMRFVSNQV